MISDFIALKLERLMEETKDPFELEVQEILYEKYLSGEVSVDFIGGEPHYSVSGDSHKQLELPLEI